MIKSSRIQLNLFFCIVSFCTLIFFEIGHSASSVRRPNENWHIAAEKVINFHELNNTSAYSMRQKAIIVDLSRVTRLSPRAGYAAFKKFRDERIYNGDAQSDFRRRLSWLYPADGCWIRAHLFALRVFNHFKTQLTKVFIFGNLKVNTPNSPSGKVTWWYHVAPVVMVNDKPYVFDPAINPFKPISLRSWVEVQTTVDNAELSICHMNTYTPQDDCYGSTVVSAREASDSLKGYLSLEWQNQIDLGRNPDKWLGTPAPWHRGF